MDWQETVALLLVAGTAALFVWGIRKRRSSFSQRTGCGCSAGSSQGASVVLRARKGERPQVLVKFSQEPPLRKTTN